MTFDFELRDLERFKMGFLGGRGLSVSRSQRGGLQLPTVSDVIDMPVKRRAPTKCTCGCAVRLRPFVFILGTGRSGSTSLLWFLNALPGMHIVGENLGIGNLLVQLSDALVQTEHKGGLYTAWTNSFDAASLQCDLAKLLLRLINPAPSARLVGFKTIRVFEAAPRLASLFPCARFIINVRGSVSTQARSSFYRLNSRRAERDQLQNHSATLLEFARQHPTISHVIRTEELTRRGLTKLLRWLGRLDENRTRPRVSSAIASSLRAPLEFDTTRHSPCPTHFDRVAMRALPTADPCSSCPRALSGTALADAAYAASMRREQALPFGNCSVLRVPKVDGVITHQQLASWQPRDARHEGIVACRP